MALSASGVPLTVVSHMLDCQLYGLNPAGHHLTNVLLHASSSVLLFLVLLRMTGDLWPSAWVAAVFAIHPLHVESVAWLAERRDVLSGLFFMLTLGAYALYVERSTLSRYLAVVGLFALGLMSKPMLVTVPFLLLLLDYWPLDRFRRTAGGGVHRPNRACGSVACPWAGGWCWKKSRSWPWRRWPPRLRRRFNCRRQSARSSRPIVAAGTAGQCPDFVCRVPGSVFLSHQYGGLLSISAGSRRPPWLRHRWFCWWRSPRLPHIAGGGRPYRVGWLAVVFGNAGAGHWTGAVRRSCPGRPLHVFEPDWLVNCLGLGCVECLSATTISSGDAVAAVDIGVVSAAAVLLLAAVAWRQTTYWRDTESLFTHALACTEHNVLAHYNLAYPFTRQGRITEAIGHLREALADDSIDRVLVARCHGLLGDCLATQGKIDEAFAQYEEFDTCHPRRRDVSRSVGDCAR